MLGSRVLLSDQDLKLSATVLARSGNHWWRCLATVVQIALRRLFDGVFRLRVLSGSLDVCMLALARVLADEVCNPRMAASRRKHRGIVTFRIADGVIRTRFQKNATDLDMPTHGRKHQRRAALGVDGIHRCPAPQMQRNGRGHPRGEREPEKRAEWLRWRQEADPPGAVHA